MWVRLESLNVCKGVQIPESGKYLLVQSGIELKESGNPVTIVIRNPSFTDEESGIQHMESSSQGCLGLPYLGRDLVLCGPRGKF